MSSLGWTEKQRKLKQHARETAARRRKWEKIAADQEAEEEDKLKKALEKRRRELDSKNRYLRQPLAKPPPAKRSFLTKGSKRCARAGVDRHDDAALTNQRGMATRPEVSKADKREGRENLKAFIREKREALKGSKVVADGACEAAVTVAAPRAQWKNLKEEANTGLESILNRYSSQPRDEEAGGPTHGGQRYLREVQENHFSGGETLAEELSSPRKPPRPPQKKRSPGEVGVAAAREHVEDDEVCENKHVLGPTSLRRGCVSTARHRPTPLVFAADSLDGSAVELSVPKDDSLEAVDGQQEQASQDGTTVLQDLIDLRSFDASGREDCGRTTTTQGEEDHRKNSDAGIDAVLLHDSLDFYDKCEKTVLEEGSSNHGEEEGVPDVSGSVLELKYFGDLAAKRSGAPNSASGSIPPSGTVDARKEKDTEKSLAWWCDAEDVAANHSEKADSGRVFHPELEWGEGSLANTMNNKNKLPKKDARQSRYNAWGGDGMVNDLLAGALTAAPPIVKPLPAQNVVCMRQVSSEYTYQSPRKPAPSDFVSLTDQSLGSVVKSKLKSTRTPSIEKRAGLAAENEGQMQAFNEKAKQKDVLQKKRQKPRQQIEQGIEGPLMCKGSYAQSVQDKVYSLEMMASKAKAGQGRAKAKDKVARASPKASNQGPSAEPQLRQASARFAGEALGPIMPSRSKSPEKPTMKARQYKHISPADMEAFTKPSVVRFTDRVRDEQGVVTTLSMEENRLKQSLARLDREYLQLGGGRKKDHHPVDAKVVERLGGLTEEGLLASLQRLDLHLKEFSHSPCKQTSERETKGTPQGGHAPREIADEPGVTLTTQHGFKRRDVVLRQDRLSPNGGLPLYDVAAKRPLQEKHLKAGFVYRNLAKVAPAVSGNPQGNPAGLNDRRGNVGLTNGKTGSAGASRNTPTATECGTTTKGEGSQPPDLGGQKLTATSRKNNAVRMHIGDSGGKIVLSQAAKNLLL